MNTTVQADTIAITGYVPGAIGRVVELHGTYYAANWGLGLYFEAKVAAELAELMSRFDPARDGAWFALDGETIVGAIFIDGQNAAGEGARLRWFILDPAYQGHGVGSRLIAEAMNFCRAAGFKRIYLTTFSGLKTARHLYEKHGFRLVHEVNGAELTGSAALVEQKLAVELA